MAAGNTAVAPEPIEANLDGDVTDGPFSVRQLLRIDEALTAADRETGLTFSVYVGSLHEPTTGAARGLHDKLANPSESVLVAVSPQQRKLEIVTGERAAKRIPDRNAALAALSMTAAFGGGDLTRGIVDGLRQLADQAGAP
ncbi:hypothetical protein Snas_4628 [Stackebrandtia nassauensis DSM 44728]|uniref:DUF5130 domain-containing protein n=1 Tax=Stackebrandtia nassauensis (strain DSM 44728 / CIP 108903 / NRRL B-16338 / NBRC 102104 / LLR-40K-21) TaxID=446470 RepID=D3Q6M8_STANL|nr:DUF5130 family protein [Stackebrandtia nassauensis]ADD44271.1 hypothetical protein Snas_4628 [Stackebrandtia nassauensis DSM 44728]